MARRASAQDSSHPSRSKAGARSRGRGKTGNVRKPKKAGGELDNSGISRRPGAGRRKVTESDRSQFRHRHGPRFTGRAIVLGTVIVLLALTLAYPAQRYLAQQAQIAQLERSEQAQRIRINGLRAQKEHWDDPDYVRAQARKRRQYVEPGEMAYIIKEDTTVSAHKQQASQRKAAKKAVWYSKVWSEFAEADRPSIVEEPD